MNHTLLMLVIVTTILLLHACTTMLHVSVTFSIVFGSKWLRAQVFYFLHKNRIKEVLNSGIFYLLNGKNVKACEGATE